MTAPQATQIADAAVEESLPPAAPSGTRSGVLLGAASAASIVANYAFLLAAGRVLGSEDYGSLAALLGLLAVVLIPAGAIQMAVSREISRLVAGGHKDRADSFARAVLRLALVGTVPLLGVALALAVPLAHLLNIDSVGVVALTEFALATALVFPAASGVLQGSQRFHALAVLYVLPFVLRLVLLAVLALAGYRLGGAVLATVAATIAGTLATVALIREQLHRGARFSAPSLRPFLRYLAPVGVGLVGIALLTHVDILVVKARFSGDEAGAYAAASAFARVGFFLPTTILAVLFPRTAARQARGQETEDILGRSLLATAAFCGALVLFYLAAGVGLVATTFGPDFAEGGKVLAPFALAIGLFSLANILVGYHLSRGETRYAWIVAGGVVAQVALLAVVPSSLRGVVWTNAVVGAALIAAHEALVGSSVPAVRAGLAHARGAALGVRAFVSEAGLAMLAAAAFVCTLYWPVVEHFGSTIMGYPGSDATATVAGFWERRHEGGYHLLGMTHHTLSGAPFGWDESNALNTQVFLAYYPTYLVAHVIGDVAAYNLATLAGFVLSGLSMYLLVRYLRCTRLVAAWGALAFIVFPFHIAHEEHASLVHVEVLALLLLSLVAVAERPTWLRVSLVGVSNLVCWLMSGYFGPMAAVTTVAFSLGAALTVDGRRRAKLVLGSTAAAVAAAGLLGVVAVASGTNAGAGLGRAPGDLSIFGIRPTDLLVPPTGNIVLGDRLESFWNTHAHGANLAEIVNYVGWLSIVLAATWIVFCILRRHEVSERQRIATAGLVAAFIVALLFAAPSPLIFFGHKVVMPARLLFAVVPAFRVLSRWDFMLLALLIPLAGLGLQVVWRALRRRRARFAVAAVGLAMVLSFLELTIQPADPRFRSAPAPPEFAAVRDTPDGIVADYPLGYSDIFRLWQSVHGRPLVNGAPEDSQADYARLVLLDPAQPGTAESLALLGVTAIGIHPNVHVDAEVLPGSLAQAKGYRLVGRFPDGASVWQVVAAAAEALVMPLPGGFAKPRRIDGGLVGYPLVSPSGVAVLEFAAQEPKVVRLIFDGIPPKGAQRPLRLADSNSEQAFTLNGSTVVELNVEIPRGLSQLLVKTDPPATSEQDAVVVSLPRAEKATGEPVLHADLISPEPGF
jgi:O-antigen/teichoic acid export membrane protein